jgi:hypothetical protein
LQRLGGGSVLAAECAGLGHEMAVAMPVARPTAMTKQISHNPQNHCASSVEPMLLKLATMEASNADGLKLKCIANGARNAGLVGPRRSTMAASLL